MRKILLLCLLLQFALLPLHAQRLKWLRQTGKAALEDGSHALPGKTGVSYQLNRRLERSYRAARQAMEQIPPDRRIPIGEPVRRGRHVKGLDAQELYELSFLTTPQQTADYLLSRNNRLFLQESKRMEKVWEQINTYLPTLTQEAQQFKQPENPLQWLADEIPLNLDQLFIGETHGHIEIRQAIDQLVVAIRRKQPNREIILFTEFIPQDVTWTGPESTPLIPSWLHSHIPTWEKAVQNGIRVIGLEPQAVIQSSCDCSYRTNTGLKGDIPIWATLEGVRLRNERWLKTLTAYRAQHPHALFLIYTGAEHAFYNRPFSLAANYPKQTTFIVALYPNKKSVFVSSGLFDAAVLTSQPYSGPIETISEQADFPQSVIKWSTPQLAEIAGFDVRLKVPVKLEGIDY